MVTHGAVSEHPVVLSFSDLSVWCYLCEAYVHNQILFEAKNAAHCAKFGEEIPPWCWFGGGDQKGSSICFSLFSCLFSFNNMWFGQLPWKPATVVLCGQCSWIWLQCPTTAKNKLTPKKKKKRSDKVFTFLTTNRCWSSSSSPSSLATGCRFKSLKMWPITSRLWTFYSESFLGIRDALNIEFLSRWCQFKVSEVMMSQRPRPLTVAQGQVFKLDFCEGNCRELHFHFHHNLLLSVYLQCSFNQSRENKIDHSLN